MVLGVPLRPGGALDGPREFAFGPRAGDRGALALVLRIGVALLALTVLSLPFATAGACVVMLAALVLSLRDPASRRPSRRSDSRLASAQRDGASALRLERRGRGRDQRRLRQRAGHPWVGGDKSARSTVARLWAGVGACRFDSPGDRGAPMVAAQLEFAPRRDGGFGRISALPLAWILRWRLYPAKAALRSWQRGDLRPHRRRRRLGVARGAGAGTNQQSGHHRRAARSKGRARLAAAQSNLQRGRKGRNDR